LTMLAGMARQERVALEASRAFSTAAEVGCAVVLSVPEAPDSPMLNRVVGLGIERPATEADVDDALSAIDDGVTFYVALTTGARPAELPEWLRARGLEPGWGWMVFRRGVEDPPSVETSLELVEVNTSDEAAAFARVVRVSYELPEASEPRLAGLPDVGCAGSRSMATRPLVREPFMRRSGWLTSVLRGRFPSIGARARRVPSSGRASAVPLGSVAMSWSRRQASEGVTDLATPTATSCGPALRRTQ
jgi:hypothetical protein